MPLSEEQKDYIRELSNDEWIDPSLDLSDEEFEKMCDEVEEETIDFVNHTDNPEELHYFAETWNWDGGFEMLHLLLDNPACDQGTALMIYWLAQPDILYRKYANESQAPLQDKEIYQFIEEIEYRLMEKSFQNNQIQYAPPNKIIEGYDQEKDQYARPIPEELLKPNL